MLLKNFRYANASHNNLRSYMLKGQTPDLYRRHGGVDSLEQHTLQTYEIYAKETI